MLLHTDICHPLGVQVLEQAAVSIPSQLTLVYHHPVHEEHASAFSLHGYGRPCWRRNQVQGLLQGLQLLQLLEGPAQ
jgi:hypothetical protein